MKKVIIFLLTILLVFSSYCLSDINKFIGAVYWKTDSITIAWDPVDHAEGYQVRMVWVDPKNEQVYDLGTTTETSISVNRIRTGHFKVMVRAYYHGFNGEILYSDWSSSDNPNVATVDGQPMAWLIFFKVPPVGGIVID